MDGPTVVRNVSLGIMLTGLGQTEIGLCDS